jgi:hypothetical protein
MDEIKIQEQLAGHRARNKALLGAIVTHGISLESQRPTDHNFNVKREADARNLEIALASLGFTEIHLSRVGWFVFSTWHVSAVLQASPNEVTADAFAEKLIRFAAEHAAIYDGWGMSLG